MTGSNPKSQSPTTAGFPVTGAFDRLNEQVKVGSQAWMQRLQEMQAVEAEYTKELLATRDPTEALKICNRWITKRLELLAADSKAFTGFWMDLVMTAADGAEARSTPAAKGADA
jgi:hypothetical protein